MRHLLALSTLVIAGSALHCYNGYTVYGYKANREDYYLKECSGETDCCGVVWGWYGGVYDCYHEWQTSNCYRPMNKSREHCVSPWNGHGWDGPSEGTHFCVCEDPFGHCMPDFPDNED